MGGHRQPEEKLVKLEISPKESSYCQTLLKPTILSSEEGGMDILAAQMMGNNDGEGGRDAEYGDQTNIPIDPNSMKPWLDTQTK